jgi:hypothetical protein
LRVFWQCLEEQHGLAAVRQEWSVALGPAFEAAFTFLRDAGLRASEYPCPRGCGCRHQVVRHEDGEIVAACQCEEYCCPSFTLGADDTRVFEVDEAKLGRAIARALECKPLDVALSVPGVRQIAALGYPPMPLLFTICHSPEESLKIVTALVATLRERFVLLTPTNAFADARAQALLSSVGAGHSGLDPVLTLEAGGRFSARQSAGELFSRYLPPQPEPMNQGEAQRVFALMQSLEDGPKLRKAPLAWVFRFLVMEGHSQKQAAVECGCAPSLISKRVKAIEEKMRSPIQRLRLLGRSLGDMERGNRSDRRRTRHREEDG